MNFLWETPRRAAVPPDWNQYCYGQYLESWELDFSRETLLPLNESHLDENVSIGHSKANRWEPIGNRADHPDELPTYVPLQGRVDHNRDGDHTGDGDVAVNLNHVNPEFPLSPDDPEVLSGFDDWAFLSENASTVFRASPPGEQKAMPGRNRSGAEVIVGTDEFNSGCATFAQLSLLDDDASDCNGNGTPDEVDIALGTSLDVDGNGVPDECEAVYQVGVPEGTAGSGIRLGATRTGGDGFLLSFYVPVRIAVRLDIVDVSGRLVKEVFEGEVSAGGHGVRWEGEGRSGPVGSGVYFATLEAGNVRVSRKLLLVR